MIGLWTARKYEIPVDRTFALVNRRFRTSQGPGGTWAYDFARTGADGGNAITCIALLGVAIGHVVAPDPGVKPETDPVIINAFTALSRTIGAPVGDIKDRPTVKEVGGLYFLWAMERIAVLYDLQKLDKKDWYLWGAEILVCNQSGNGSWGEDGGFPGQSPIVNTCLALLFLKRANLTPDLSKKLLVNTDRTDSEGGRQDRAQARTTAAIGEGSGTDRDRSDATRGRTQAAAASTNRDATHTTAETADTETAAKKKTRGSSSRSVWPWPPGSAAG